MDNGGPSPLERCRDFFDQNFNKRINKINEQKKIHNLINKKDEIYTFLDNLEYELNFNISKFREEFNLSKEDFSDEYLISLYKENHCDKKKTFYAIIIKNNNK